MCGSGGVTPPFLTSTQDGSQSSALRSGHFTSRERAPGTHWIRGWVGPRAGLDAVGQRKISPLPGIEFGRPARSPSLFCFSNSNYLSIVISEISVYFTIAMPTV
jgi:hypothetical protein